MNEHRICSSVTVCSRSDAHNALASPSCELRVENSDGQKLTKKLLTNSLINLF